MHHNRFITGVLLAGVLAVLSCGKESPTVGVVGTPGGTAIEYSVETGTRATLVDSREGFVGMSDNSFVVTAMNGTATTVPTQTVTYSSTKDRWCTVTPYVWPYSAGVMSELTFYAWTTPATGQGTVSLNTSTGKATFSYTTPASAKDQKDIMFGYFKGSNAQGIASLSFKHALAAVDMKMGTVLPGYSVSNVVISGVVEGGTCTLTFPATFSWALGSGTGTTQFSPEDDDAAPGYGTVASGGKIGKGGIMLVPQTLTSSAKITLSLKDSGGNVKTLEYGLTGVSLTRGYLTSLTLNTTDKMSVSVTVTPLSTESTEILF